jgi:hypothetical protein
LFPLATSRFGLGECLFRLRPLSFRASPAFVNSPGPRPRPPLKPESPVGGITTSPGLLFLRSSLFSAFSPLLPPLSLVRPKILLLKLPPATLPKIGAEVLSPSNADDEGKLTADFRNVPAAFDLLDDAVVSVLFEDVPAVSAIAPDVVLDLKASLFPPLFEDADDSFRLLCFVSSDSDWSSASLFSSNKEEM